MIEKYMKLNGTKKEVAAVVSIRHLKKIKASRSTDCS